MQAADIKLQFEPSVFVQIGKHLHAQFFAVVGDLHPNDDSHNEALGRLMHSAVVGRWREGQAEYNRWAAGANYVPVYVRPEGENFAARFQLNEEEIAVATVSNEMNLLNVVRERGQLDPNSKWECQIA